VANFGPEEGFASRLRAERIRLRLSQGEVAAAAGIAKPTQVAYEQGVRTPTIDYLLPLEASGFDVTYLLRGVRAPKHVSKELDWQMLTEIRVAVRNWCNGKGLELTVQEEQEIARELYDRFVLETVEPAAVDRVLTLIYSKRSA
jgi:transcriptional regulator with XRE-family HTH domain